MVFSSGDIVEIFENRGFFFPITSRDRTLGIVVDILKDHNYHKPKALVLMKTGSIIEIDADLLVRI